MPTKSATTPITTHATQLGLFIVSVPGALMALVDELLALA